MKKIGMLIFGILLIGIASATTTTLSVNPTSLILGKGNSSQLAVSYSINNLGGFSGSKGIQLTGSPLFLSYSGGSINYAENTTTTGNIMISVNIPLNSNAGNYENYIIIDGVILTIPITIQEAPQPSSGVIVFPTAKVINVQQSQIKNQNIQVIVPSSYPRVITIQSVSFNPDLDLIQFGDLDLGQLSPGQTLNIPIIVDARNVQSGDYNTQITILATDSQGQVQLSPSNLKIVVSVGVNPSTNETFTTKPSCSLSAIELNLNSSYTLICTNVGNNLEISTPYNSYIEGIRADLSSTTYTYTFKAVKIGTTTFIVTFNYKGFSIFSPFTQEIRITPSGSSPVAGTTLRFEFYQDGIKREHNNLLSGITNVLILDNKTNSVVPSYTLYLNGLFVNSTLNLEIDKNYELRVSSGGYLDNVINFTVSKKEIGINLIPDKSSYEVFDIVNLTCDVENCSFLLDDSVITSPYTFSASGTFLLKAVKENYITTNKTIEVKSLVNLGDCTPVYDKWKKGSDVVCEITKNVSWDVYRDGLKINSGEGLRLDFKIDEHGIYEIKSGDYLIKQANIKGRDWIYIFRWSTIKSKWLWYLIIVPLILVGGWLLFFRKSGIKSKGIGFGSKTYGANINTGA